LARNFFCFWHCFFVDRHKCRFAPRACSGRMAARFSSDRDGFTSGGHDISSRIFCFSFCLPARTTVCRGRQYRPNFVTLTFVAGICALWRPIEVGPTLRTRESSWMILGAALLLIFAMDSVISRIDGILLLAAYIPYFLGTLDDARRQRNRETKNSATSVKRPWLEVIIFSGGLGVIILGSSWVVENGTALARMFGMSDLLIGVTFYSFGTSLPELAIALGAVIRHQANVTLGEIYASNIFTGLAVVGTLCVIKPLVVEPIIVQRDLPMLIVAGVLLQMFITIGRRFVRLEALVMIGIYALFLAAQFMGFSISLD